MGRRLKKTVKDETGKERITYYGWDGDRLVHTERMKDDGTRDIVHTVYEPGTFTPMLRLSTHAKGDPQVKPHLMVQAAKAVVPEQQQDDANTTAALQGLQGAMSGMPEAMRKMLEQGMRQALQGGLSPMAKSIVGGMGINPDALIGTMNKGIEEERQRGQTPIDILFYHCDHLGMPIALTDRQGQIAWAAKHDPWGNTQEEFNPHGIEQPIRLPGQHLDRETGLYYNRYRYYDSKIGAYINQDPIGLRGGLNLLKYSDTPLLEIDPYGLQAAGPAASTKTGGTFGLGIEANKSRAYADGTHYVGEDTGHTYAYVKDEKDNIVCVYSVGPAKTITDDQLKQFAFSGIPGQTSWIISEKSKAWEWPLDEKQYQACKKLCEKEKNKPIKYSPSSQCTSEALKLANACGISTPDGVGDVNTGKPDAKGMYGGRFSNPYELNDQMSKPGYQEPKGIGQYEIDATIGAHSNDSANNDGSNANGKK